MNILFSLFLTFAKIGLFTFGGGYAMISVFEDICVEKKKWISHEDMMNITVIAESTPGPISINCATFVGYKQAGIWGAVFASIGMIVPSFCVIYVISIFLNNFLEIIVVANAFKGIKIAVGILILDVAIRMIKKMQKNIMSYAIVFSSTVFMLLINIFSLDFSSINLMLIAAVIGIIIFSLFGNPEQKGGIKK